MKVFLTENHCEVVRESHDPRFKDGGWGSAESTLLHHVKKELIKQGFDLIKKRMWKDGHLVDDRCQYLRTRKPTGYADKDIYVWDGNYQVRNAAEDFNKEGKVVYNVMRGIFNK